MRNAARRLRICWRRFELEACFAIVGATYFLWACLVAVGVL